MTHSPICLDITRLVSRVGLGALSGVDRVERAYLTWVLSRVNVPYFLCRTTRGYLLFDRKGGERLARLIDGVEPLGQADLASRLFGKAGNERHRTEGSLRPLKIGSALPQFLPRLLRKCLPPKTIYLNVGQSNLSQNSLAAMAQAGAGIAAMIHDLIPIQHPSLVAGGSAARFERMLTNLRTHADLLIANSNDTKQHIRDYFVDLDIPVAVAHLGMVDRPAKGEAPPNAPMDRPYFVALGTLEPRKNHALLLDVWDILAQEMNADDLPYLHIIGRRGWKNEDVFDRLDHHPLKEKAIFEHGALPDGQARALITDARALLFPSLAEGFGYPPLEALEDGVLPLCADLPVLKETIGDRAVYLDVSDTYSWAQTITQLCSGTVFAPVESNMNFPTWDDHFEKLDVALSGIMRDA